LNAEVIKDKFNNVVARIPATKGYQKLPMITLQAHSDMVTVKKDGYKHDFNKDSLSLIFNENYVIARNTSLGADNGIGIALILALFADTSKPHGPLEAIITTKEEIGLLGAKALNPKYVQGEYLINLDSENDKEIIIGCVGSSTIDSYTNLKLIKTKYSNQFLLSINNLLSGHSGLDIAKGHMNAIKGIFYVMQQIQKKYQCCISDITGGSVLNAIPSSAYVAFNTNAQLSDLQKIIQKCHEKLIQTYPTEGKFQLSLSPTKLVKESINEQQTNLIIVFFNRVFNGVKTFNKKYQLPQASSNLGKVFIRNKQLYIGFNGRDLHVKSKLETNR
jgi:dipeptidase D